MKAQYLYSNIFEKEEDCKNNPFVFEKFNLSHKRHEYVDFKFEGPLLKRSKSRENELKECFFIYQDNKLIQFKVKILKILNVTIVIARYIRKGNTEHKVCQTEKNPF